MATLTQVIYRAYGIQLTTAWKLVLCCIPLYSWRDHRASVATTREGLDQNRSFKKRSFTQIPAALTGAWRDYRVVFEQHSCGVLPLADVLRQQGKSATCLWAAGVYNSRVKFLTRTTFIILIRV